MSQPANPRRIAVIGAGAAGTMAAIFAAAAGAQVTLIERTKDGGRKILISGGGRCNVLPLRVDEQRFVTDSSPNTLRRIIRSWPLAEQRRFFEEDVGVPLSEEEALLKVFPTSHKARDVRDGLLALAERRGATLRMDSLARDVAPAEGGWRVTFADDVPLDVDAVINATGGLSVPATGSEGFGLALARRLGHTVHPTYAALTPITDAAGTFAALGGERFLAEITTTAKLQHPHILPLLDSGETDGLLYYVMPSIVAKVLSERPVATFPDGRVRRMVSRSGGWEPRFARSGREVFFESAGRLWSVRLSGDAGITAGEPQPLFTLGGYRRARNRQQYDVAPGDQRFLMIKDPPPPPVPALVYVENWFPELRARLRQ